MSGFVHIIESPSSEDLLDGRTEGNALNEALDLAGIPRWYSLATNKKTLYQALGQRLIEAWRYWQQPPVLHLSMHGNHEGVALTSDEFLTWHELRQNLLPLTYAMQGGLLICMSTCFGSSGCRMAMYMDQEYPFWALVGNSASATWADSAVAYITFYHLFFTGQEIEACVEAMRIASADQNFTWFSGHETRMGWINFIQQRGDFSHRLEAAAAEAQQWQ